MTTIVNLSAEVARAAGVCVAEHDIRYNLRGILIEPRAEGGAFVVGTNGHVMCVAIDESATVSRRVILSLPKPVLKALPRLSKHHDFKSTKGKRLVLKENTLKNQELHIAGVHDLPTQAGSFLIDGPIIDWRKVLPQPEDEMVHVDRHLDLSLLSKIGKGLVLTNGLVAHRMHQIKVPGKEIGSGVNLLHLTSVSNVFYIVMSMSDTERDHERSLATCLSVASAARASTPWAAPGPEFLTEDPDHAIDPIEA